MIKAIVYKSKTGSAEEYSRMLSEETGIPSMSLKEASGRIGSGSEIIYLGCIRADGISGMKKALDSFEVRAAAAVGMGHNENSADRIRKASSLPDGIPLFTLQGNYHEEKLRGMDRLMMKMMKGVLSKQIREKERISKEETDLLELLENGGDRVSRKNIAGMLSYIRQL